MARFDDFFGSKVESKDERERIEIDGMCECFWPFSHGLYDKSSKQVTIYCSNPEEQHQSIMEIDLDG